MVAKRKPRPPPARVLDALAADCAGGKSDYVSVPVSVLLQMIAVCRAGAA